MYSTVFESRALRHYGLRPYISSTSTSTSTLFQNWEEYQKAITCFLYLHTKFGRSNNKPKCFKNYVTPERQ